MLGNIDRRRLDGDTLAALVEAAKGHHERPEPNDHGGIVLILTHAVTAIVKRNNEFVVYEGKVAIIVQGRGFAESCKTSHSVESEDSSGDDGRKNDTVKARATAGTEGAHVIGPNSDQLETGVASHEHHGDSTEGVDDGPTHALRVAFNVCLATVFSDVDHVFLSFHPISPVGLVFNIIALSTVGEDESNIVPDDVTGISDLELLFNRFFGFIIASVGPLGLNVARVDHV